ncbi:MAG: ferrous iron transporter B [Firmicutes bacterium]|nr:ferrous iron transporter B [Bacillota bacterium]
MKQEEQERGFTVALAGNPNVGKSTVFNALTGLRQHTGNWSGKTVRCAEGRFTYHDRIYRVIDLPGCYSLEACSEEEREARALLMSGRADAAAVVCDATCLERNLILALQIKELLRPVLVCVNMLDEAQSRGIEVDLAELERQLGLPVVGISARRRGGAKPLLPLLEQVRLRDEKEAADNKPQAHADSGQRAVELAREARRICRSAVRTSAAARARDRKLDRWLTGPLAFPLLLLLLVLIFWLTISGANYPSALLSSLAQQAEGWLRAALLSLGSPAALTDALTRGLFRVLAWVVSVMLPPMAIFFPLFTLLEDAGFLPRVAYDLDRCFRGCCACGKQALTVCMGYGCNAVGVSGCRIIDSPRERLVAILTNSVTPCNGRFPALIAVMTMFFLGNAAGVGASFGAAAGLAALIVFSLMMTLFLSKLLSATVLSGLPSSFTLELPPFRRPEFCRVILRSVLDRTLFVLGRAAMVAAPAGLVIWLLANTYSGGLSLLAHAAAFLDPFGRLLGLDGVILLAFILGLPANEIVIPVMIMAYMAGEGLTELPLSALHQLLLAQGWTWATAVSFLIFSLMHWPCSTTIITIYKETRSLKWTALAVALPAVAGVTVCMLFTFIVRLLGF